MSKCSDEARKGARAFNTYVTLYKNKREERVTQHQTEERRITDPLFVVLRFLVTTIGVRVYGTEDRDNHTDSNKHESKRRRRRVREREREKAGGGAREREVPAETTVQVVHITLNVAHIFITLSVA